MANKDEDIIYVDGCPNWMLTLGDCMSLLVTFFVMLLSFSTPNKDQLQDALEGMKGALSVMSLGNSPAPREAISRSKQDSDSKVDAFDAGGQTDSRVSEDKLAVVTLSSMKVANRFNDFKERILELGFHKYVMAKQMDLGITVDIPFDKLFDPNSSELTPESYLLLQSFANLAGSIRNEIRLVAVFHSDSIQGNDIQEWSLPRKRAFAVGRALSDRYKIGPKRITYGYEIAADNQLPYLRMLLAEKLDINRITINELISFEQDL